MQLFLHEAGFYQKQANKFVNVRFLKTINLYSEHSKNYFASLKFSHLQQK